MVSTKNNKTDFQRKVLSADNLHTFGVVRKYMNGAVYVESPVDTFSNDLIRLNEPNFSNENIAIKRISCSCTAEQFCKIHENQHKYKVVRSSSNLNQSIKQERDTSPVDDFKVSNLLLETLVDYSDDTERAKQDSYKQWTLKKNEEKKRIEENQIYIKEIEGQQKENRLHQERENFKRWLTNKKKEEEKRKLEKEKSLEDQKSTNEIKERRGLEAKLRYQLWLKQKEQEELEKRIKEQMEIMKNAEDKQRRLETNEKVFKSWVENSKYKPKPIPLSRGLDSLRSSVSLTYINPVPWTPNIEEAKPKPASQ